MLRFREENNKTSSHEDDVKCSKSVTLGEILIRELLDIGNFWEWELKICESKEESYLRIGFGTVPIGEKYEHIIGLPTHSVVKYSVYSSMGTLQVSNKDFSDVDWKNVSEDDINERMKILFLTNNNFYSEEDAINSLPEELVLDIKRSGPHSISPYDKYGYHIENISAYYEPDAKRQGVFIHIRKGKIEDRIL